ncbi:MAG: glycoside hydrolase family 16 protein [bacterium]|nr:glycoside hydrolase family 16 protein [bacterium]
MRVARQFNIKHILIFSLLITYIGTTCADKSSSSGNTLSGSDIPYPVKPEETKLAFFYSDSDITVDFASDNFEIIPYMDRKPRLDYDFIGTRWHKKFSMDRIWIRSKRRGPWRNRFQYANLECTEEYKGIPGGFIHLKIKAGKRSAAEFLSRQNDYFYGRYEARLKPSSVPDCVNAFFIMDPNNKGEEIDIEFLTNEFGKYTGKVHFVLHPHKNLPPNLYHRIVDLNFNPAADFHTYGFTWSKEKIEFYVDDKITAEFLASQGAPVKKSPGSIYLNVWSGNSQWGGGPPKKNAVMVVDRVRYWPEE